MTVHKCQGQTMDEVIIDFDGDENNRKAFITAGSFYVAITRVTNGIKAMADETLSVTYIKTDSLISWATINTMRD